MYRSRSGLEELGSLWEVVTACPVCLPRSSYIPSHRRVANHFIIHHLASRAPVCWCKTHHISVSPEACAWGRLLYKRVKTLSGTAAQSSGWRGVRAGEQADLWHDDDSQVFHDDRTIALCLYNFRFKKMWNGNGVFCAANGRRSVARLLDQCQKMNHMILSTGGQRSVRKWMPRQKDKFRRMAQWLKLQTKCSLFNTCNILTLKQQYVTFCLKIWIVYIHSDGWWKEITPLRKSASGLTDISLCNWVVEYAYCILQDISRNVHHYLLCVPFI